MRELKTIKDIELHLKIEFNTMLQLLPIKFRRSFRKNAYICGGSIYSLRHGKSPKDYDFFLRDKNLTDALLHYFKNIQKIKRCNGMYKGAYKGKSLLITEYAISIGKYQIIIKYCGEPSEIVGEFDFKHNQFAYFDGKIHNFTDWEYLDGNELVFNENRARDKIGCLVRIPKFTARGMTIRKDEVKKILSKIDDDPKNQEFYTIGDTHFIYSPYISAMIREYKENRYEYF